LSRLHYANQGCIMDFILEEAIKKIKKKSYYFVNFWFNF